MTNLVKFNHSNSEIYKAYFKYCFFCIITMGLYLFWGQNKLRNFWLKGISIEQNYLDFQGATKEIWLGFLTIIAIIDGPKLICYGFFALEILKNKYSFGFSNFFDNFDATNAQLRLILGIYSLIMSLILGLMAGYLNKKYILNRMSFLNNNFSLKTKDFKFLLYNLANFLSIFLFNLFTPCLDIKRKKYFFDNLYYGNQPFSFAANYKNLNSINLITTLLFIPTLGLSRFWYHAALEREVYNNLEFGEIKFSSNITSGALLEFYGLNILILFLSFGLAIPLIKRNSINFFIKYHQIIGDISLLETINHSEKTLVENDYSCGYGWSNSFLLSPFSI